jgi:hypothetical protein
MFAVPKRSADTESAQHRTNRRTDKQTDKQTDRPTDQRQRRIDKQNAPNQHDRVQWLQLVPCRNCAVSPTATVKKYLVMHATNNNVATYHSAGVSCSLAV